MSNQTSSFDKKEKDKIKKCLLLPSETYHLRLALKTLVYFDRAKNKTNEGAKDTIKNMFVVTDRESR